MAQPNDAGIGGGQLSAEERARREALRQSLLANAAKYAPAPRPKTSATSSAAYDPLSSANTGKPVAKKVGATVAPAPEEIVRQRRPAPAPVAPPKPSIPTVTARPSATSSQAYDPLSSANTGRRYTPPAPPEPPAAPQRLDIPSRGYNFTDGSYTGATPQQRSQEIDWAQMAAQATAQANAQRRQAEIDARPIVTRVQAQEMPPLTDPARPFPPPPDFSKPANVERWTQQPVPAPQTFPAPDGTTFDWRTAAVSSPLTPALPGSAEGAKQYIADRDLYRRYGTPGRSTGDAVVDYERMAQDEIARQKEAAQYAAMGLPTTYMPMSEEEIQAIRDKQPWTNELFATGSRAADAAFWGLNKAVSTLRIPFTERTDAQGNPIPDTGLNPGGGLNVMAHALSMAAQIGAAGRNLQYQAQFGIDPNRIRSADEQVSELVAAASPALTANIEALRDVNQAIASASVPGTPQPGTGPEQGPQTKPASFYDWYAEVKRNHGIVPIGPKTLDQAIVVAQRDPNYMSPMSIDGINTAISDINRQAQLDLQTARRLANVRPITQGQWSEETPNFYDALMAMGIVDGKNVPYAEMASVIASSGAEAQTRVLENFELKSELPKIRELRNQMLWSNTDEGMSAALALSSLILKLETTPYSGLVDLETNLPMELLDNFLLDPLNFFDLPLGAVANANLAGKTAKAMTGLRTLDNADDLAELSKGVKSAYKTWLEGGRVGELVYPASIPADLLKVLPTAKEMRQPGNFFARQMARTPETQVHISTNNLWVSMANILHGVDNADDAIRLLRTLSDSPQELIKGLTGLTSPAFVRIADQDGVVRWGAGVVSNPTLVREMPVFQAGTAKVLERMEKARDEAMEAAKKAGTRYDGTQQRVNPLELMVNLHAEWERAARQLHGIVPLDPPTGATKLNLHDLADGTAQVEWLDAEGKVIKQLPAQPVEAARAQLATMQDALKTATENPLHKGLRVSAEIQRHIMSDMWLNLRPAHWVRNAAAFTLALGTDGLYSFKSIPEIFQDMGQKVIAGRANYRMAEGSSGAGAMGETSGTSWMRKGWPKYNPFAWATEKGAKAWTGYGQILNSIPVAEQAAYAHALDRGFTRIFGNEWATVAKQELGPLIQSWNVDPVVAKAILDKIVETGNIGSKADVAQVARQITHGAAEPFSLRSLKIPNELIPVDPHKEIVNIVNTLGRTTPGQAPETVQEAIQRASDEIKAVFQRLRTQPGAMLNEAMPQPTGEQVFDAVDDVARMVDDAKRDAIEAGYNTPEQLAIVEEEAQQYAQKLIQGETVGWEGVLDELANAPDNPAGMAATFDLLSQVYELKRMARQEVDELMQPIRAAKTPEQRNAAWAAKFKGTRDIYTQLADDLQGVFEENKDILRRIAAGEEIPQQRDWWDVINRYLDFDPRANVQTRGQEFGDMMQEDPAIVQKFIDANRAYVDSSYIQLYDIFRRYPSMDGLDVLRMAQKQLDAEGARASAYLATQRARLKHYDEATKRVVGDLDKEDYYVIRNETWRAMFDNQVIFNQAAARAIAAHALAMDAPTQLTWTDEFFGGTFQLIGPAAKDQIADAISLTVFDIFETGAFDPATGKIADKYLAPKPIERIQQGKPKRGKGKAVWTITPEETDTYFKALAVAGVTEKRADGWYLLILNEDAAQQAIAERGKFAWLARNVETGQLEVFGSPNQMAPLSEGGSSARVPGDVMDDFGALVEGRPFAAAPSPAAAPPQAPTPPASVVAPATPPSPATPTPAAPEAEAPPAPSGGMTLDPGAPDVTVAPENVVPAPLPVQNLDDLPVVDSYSRPWPTVPQSVLDAKAVQSSPALWEEAVTAEIAKATPVEARPDDVIPDGIEPQTWLDTKAELDALRQADEAERSIAQEIVIDPDALRQAQGPEPAAPEPAPVAPAPQPIPPARPVGEPVEPPPVTASVLNQLANGSGIATSKADGGPTHRHLINAINADARKNNAGWQLPTHTIVNSKGKPIQVTTDADFRAWVTAQPAQAQQAAEWLAVRVENAAKLAAEPKPAAATKVAKQPKPKKGKAVAAAAPAPAQTVDPNIMPDVAQDVDFMAPLPKKIQERMGSEGNAYMEARRSLPAGGSGGGYPAEAPFVDTGKPGRPYTPPQAEPGRLPVGGSGGGYPAEAPFVDTGKPGRPYTPSPAAAPQTFSGHTAAVVYLQEQGYTFDGQEAFWAKGKPKAKVTRTGVGNAYEVTFEEMPPTPTRAMHQGAAPAAATPPPAAVAPPAIPPAQRAGFMANADPNDRARAEATLDAKPTRKAPQTRRQMVEQEWAQGATAEKREGLWYIGDRQVTTAEAEYLQHLQAQPAPSIAAAPAAAPTPAPYVSEPAFVNITPEAPTYIDANGVKVYRRTWEEVQAEADASTAQRSAQQAQTAQPTAPAIPTAAKTYDVTLHRGTVGRGRLTYIEVSDGFHSEILDAKTLPDGTVVLETRFGPKRQFANDEEARQAIAQQFRELDQAELAQGAALGRSNIDLADARKTFMADQVDIKRANAKKILETEINYSGNIQTRRENLEQSFLRGYRVGEDTENGKPVWALFKPDDSRHTITKTEADYFKHLEAQAAAQAAPSPATVAPGVVETGAAPEQTAMDRLLARRAQLEQRRAELLPRLESLSAPGNLEFKPVYEEWGRISDELGQIADEINKPTELPISFQPQKFNTRSDATDYLSQRGYKYQDDGMWRRKGLPDAEVNPLGRNGVHEITFGPSPAPTAAAVAPAPAAPATPGPNAITVTAPVIDTPVRQVELGELEGLPLATGEPMTAMAGAPALPQNRDSFLRLYNAVDDQLEELDRQRYIYGTVSQSDYIQRMDEIDQQRIDLLLSIGADLTDDPIEAAARAFPDWDKLLTPLGDEYKPLFREKMAGADWTPSALLEEAFESKDAVSWQEGWQGVKNAKGNKYVTEGYRSDLIDALLDYRREGDDYSGDKIASLLERAALDEVLTPESVKAFWPGLTKEMDEISARRAAVVAEEAATEAAYAAGVTAPTLPEGTRQAWQMTPEEFAMSSGVVKFWDIDRLITPEITAYKKITKTDDLSWLQGALDDSFYGTPAKQKAAKAALDSIGVPRKQRGGTWKGGEIVDPHKFVIQKALEQGKPVPPEILARYGIAAPSPAAGDWVDTTGAIQAAKAYWPNFQGNIWNASEADFLNAADRRMMDYATIGEMKRKAQTLVDDLDSEYESLLTRGQKKKADALYKKLEAARNERNRTNSLLPSDLAILPTYKDIKAAQDAQLREIWAKAVIEANRTGEYVTYPRYIERASETLGLGKGVTQAAPTPAAVTPGVIETPAAAAPASAPETAATLRDRFSELTNQWRNTPAGAKRDELAEQRRILYQRVLEAETDEKLNYGKAAPVAAPAPAPTAAPVAPAPQSVTPAPAPAAQRSQALPTYVNEDGETVVVTPTVTPVEKAATFVRKLREKYNVDVDDVRVLEWQKALEAADTRREEIMASRRALFDAKIKAKGRQEIDAIAEQIAALDLEMKPFDEAIIEAQGEITEIFRIADANKLHARWRAMSPRDRVLEELEYAVSNRNTKSDRSLATFNIPEAIKRIKDNPDLPVVELTVPVPGKTATDVLGKAEQDAIKANLKEAQALLSSNKASAVTINYGRWHITVLDPIQAQELAKGLGTRLSASVPTYSGVTPSSGGFAGILEDSAKVAGFQNIEIWENVIPMQGRMIAPNTAILENVASKYKLGKPAKTQTTFAGDADGATWYSDGYAMFGVKPKDWNGVTFDPLNNPKAHQELYTTAAKSDLALEPLGLVNYDSIPVIVLGTDDGKIKFINAKYYAGAMQAAGGKPVKWATASKKSQPIVAFVDGKPLSIIMPMAGEQKKIDQVAKYFYPTSDAGMLTLYGGFGAVDPIPAIQDIYNTLIKYWRKPKQPEIGDVALHQVTSLNDAEDRILAALPRMAQPKRNNLTAAQANALIDAIDKRLLPAFDDAVSRATYGAERMADTAMLNYRDRRGIDANLALILPYHYFYTRGGATWLRRIARKPSTANMYYDLQKAIETENAQSGVPARFKGTIPLWSYPGGQIRMANPMNSMLPWYMYMPEPFQQQEGDSDAEKLWTSIRSMTPGMMPVFDVAAAALFDQIDPLPDGASRVARYTNLRNYVPLAGMASDIAMATTGTVTPPGMGGDPFDPYRIKTAAAFMAQEGEISAEVAKYVIQLSLNLQRPGTDAWANIPDDQAAAVSAAYLAAGQRAGRDKLGMGGGAGYFAGVNFYNAPDSERELRSAQDLWRYVGYGEGNPAGSATQRQAVMAQTPALGAFMARTTQPGSPYQPGQQAQAGALYDQLDPLYAQQAAVEDKLITQSGGGVSGGALYDATAKIRQEADALRAKYPDIPAPTGKPISGSNPAEMATWMLRQAVPKGGPTYPGEGASKAEMAAYYDARSAWEKEQLATFTRNLTTIMAGSDPMQDEINFELFGLTAGKDPATLLREYGAGYYDTPIKRAYDTRNDVKNKAEAAKFDAAEALILQQFGPEGLDTYKTYSVTEDADKQAYKAAHPELKALNFAAYNPNEYGQAVALFGKDAILAWAKLPASDGSEAASKARGEYYDANPGAYLMNAWMNGRPTPYGETRGPWASLPEEWGMEYQNNYGKDFAEAAKKFGDDIWQIVAGYKRGWSSSEKGAYFDKYPQLGDFFDWWNELLPDDGKSSSTGKGYRSYKKYYKSYRKYYSKRRSYGGYSRGYGGGGWGSSQWAKEEKAPWIDPVNARYFDSSLWNTASELERWYPARAGDNEAERWRPAKYFAAR